MITFKGSQKQFFKEYTKDKRSLDETYCIVSYNVITKKEIKNYYKFIGTLGEKSFKKVDASKDSTDDTFDTNVKDVKAEEKVETVTTEVNTKSEAIAKEAVKEQPKKKTIAVKRKDLLDAFNALVGFMGNQIDDYSPVDIFALYAVCNEFNTCDFSTEPDTYVDLFKYFLGKYPKFAKDIQTCIDVIADVYADIEKNKRALEERAKFFYGDCGLLKEKYEKENKRKKSVSLSSRKR